MTKKIQNLSSILAPVSLGELIDKITILEIREIHITGIKKAKKYGFYGILTELYEEFS